MKFLVDECLSARLAQLLRDAGHDAAHVGEAGLLGATDEVVMVRAADEARVLVSADTDFGELLASSNERFPSLILFRNTGRTSTQQASLILTNCVSLQDELSHGAIIVVTSDRLRVRELPIRPN